ncbi:hypothetical protein AVEN_101926-1 [Araneus ventricosus]|uniref:Uncharacterized protein n=1 Tax=Araneus ventricosus TaxID=182803 RepID=A0A4Y2DB21_ARAVE|nr:hypothetical protein AVEN_101926-1 [Araneus ventricosus]
MEVYGASVMPRKHVWKHDFLSRKTGVQNCQARPRQRHWNTLLTAQISHQLIFHLFGTLKKHLASRHLRTNAEVQEVVVKWLRDLYPDFFYGGFDRLVYQ